MVWITGGCEANRKELNDGVICSSEAKFPSEELGTRNILSGHYEIPDQLHNRESGFSYTTYQGDPDNALLPEDSGYDNSVAGAPGTSADDSARAKTDELINEYLVITERR